MHLRLTGGGAAWGRREGGDRLGVGVWDGHVHTAIFKIDNQQGPTVYSTGNSAQYSVIT